MKSILQVTTTIGEDDDDDDCEETRKAKKPRVKVANEVDEGIGHRLKSFRLAAKMSQEQLGKSLGVTFQV